MANGPPSALGPGGAPDLRDEGRTPAGLSRSWTGSGSSASTSSPSPLEGSFYLTLIGPPRQGSVATARRRRMMSDHGFRGFRGREGRLSDFRGEFLLLDFRGTWCTPSSMSSRPAVARTLAIRAPTHVVRGDIEP